MKIFCVECGRPVPVSEDGKIVGHCRFHPEALRTKKDWVKAAFDEMRRICDEATGPGKFFSSDQNYWRHLENRARKVEGWV